MYCQKCGTHNSNGSTFCVSCGSPLYNSAPPVWNMPPAGAIPVEPTAQLGQQVCATLKSLATSPLLIIAAICYSLVLVLNLLGSANAVDMSAVYDLLRELGISYNELREMVTDLQSVSVIITFISMIPSILVAVGMWITIGSGAKKQSKQMTTSGMTMIQVIQIINTVMGSLAVLFLLLIVLIAGGMASDYSAEASAIIAICAVVMVLAAAFMIFYNVMIISTIGKIKNSIRTNQPNSKISMFVAVMCIISGGCSALSIPTSILSIPSVVSILSLVMTAAYPILFGILLISYRSRMRELEYQLNSMNYPGGAVYPGYATAPAAPTYNAYPTYPTAPQYIQPQPVEPVQQPNIPPMPQSTEGQDAQ